MRRRQLSRQRLDVKQAAEVLGISSEGVRKRIKRGNLEAEKGLDGKVYVWLDTHLTDRTSDRTDGNGPEDVTEILRDQVDYLRQQLQVWQEEARRKDHIIAALTEPIPEIEGPQEASGEPRDATVTASEAPGNDEVRTDAEKPKERPWWRRIFQE
jgi:hypothetical protein